LYSDIFTRRIIPLRKSAAVINNSSVSVGKSRIDENGLDIRDFSAVCKVLYVPVPYTVPVRLIIGSDRRSETKQAKIVRCRSCLRHFRFIISCCRHFFPFVLNFIHVIPKKGVI